MFSKGDFVIDLHARTVTCPARQVAAIPPPGRSGAASLASGEACRGCPLVSCCTTSRHGHFTEIGPDEELLAPARAGRWTKELRERSRVERKAAQLK